METERPPKSLLRFVTSSFATLGGLVSLTMAAIFIYLFVMALIALSGLPAGSD